MSTVSKTKRSPDQTKGLALRHAARAVNTVEKSTRNRDTAIWFAHDAGASLREIAEATGIPHSSVKVIIDRKPDGA